MALHNLETTVFYDNTTKIAADDQQMEIRQSYEDGIEYGPVVLGPDELQHVVEVARALGWEGFRCS